jgi:hypothetical protein
MGTSRCASLGLSCRPAKPLGSALGNGFSPFVLLQNIFYFLENKNRKREGFHISNNLVAKMCNAVICMCIIMLYRLAVIIN